MQNLRFPTVSASEQQKNHNGAANLSRDSGRSPPSLLLFLHRKIEKGIAFSAKKKMSLRTKSYIIQSHLELVGIHVVLIKSVFFASCLDCRGLPHAVVLVVCL